MCSDDLFNVCQRQPYWTLDSSPQKALRRSWKRTTETITQLRGSLKQAALPDHILTVAISGSLGRMEQVDGSDADLIVITEPCNSNHDRRLDVEQVRRAIEPLDLPHPESFGIFSESIAAETLTTHATCGLIDEPVAHFGKRIQLLLDSQPLYEEARYWKLQRAILSRYAAGDVLLDTDREWTYLVNDLMRYYRCLALNAQWKPRAPGTKPRFEAKFKHSRRLLYIALLLILGESSRHRSERFDWVARRLALTPLERIAEVLGFYHGRAKFDADDDAPHTSTQFDKLLNYYDRFIAGMNDINAVAPTAMNASLQNEQIDQLNVDGEQFSTLLSEILQASSCRWSPPMQRLLFV